ncbi:hypothetical protein CVS30_12110 [Arthrobacter psychrolactophilus]|uniref:Uncharacterized protein n=1 Tax=Arthrobacter psychrolactophilus TaxID=92442 RepID=A0A2V5JKN4_9MICC|nr:hypothetical protein CVS30_12110 [Arthrobacter psychrolactophilus]
MLTAGMVLVPSAAQAAADYRVDGTVSVQGNLSLIDGSYELSERGTDFPATNIPVGGMDDWQTTGPKIAEGKFSYRIAEFGAPTKYTVRGDAWFGHPSLTPRGNEYDFVCNVYKDDAAGNPVLITDVEYKSPYKCAAAHEVSVHGYFVDFDVMPQIVATARGVVTAVSTDDHALSLKDGVFSSGNKHLIVNGQLRTADATPDTVASGASTHFAAFMRPTEGNDSLKLARTDFSYHIVEDGFDTQFWVAGKSQNQSASRYERDAACDIYQGNPNPTQEQITAGIQPGKIVKFSPYTCDWSGANVSGRGDWEATFNVGVRQYTTLTDPAQAAEYLSKGCTSTDAECIYFPKGLPTAVDGVKTSMGSQQNVDYELPGSMSFIYTDSRAATNSMSTTVGVLFEASAPWAKVQTSLSLTYGISTTVTTAKSTTYTLPVPPRKTVNAFFTPAYQQVSGEFFFEYAGQYFRSTSSTVTFPDPSNQGRVSSENVPLQEHEYGGALPPAPVTDVKVPVIVKEAPVIENKTPLGEVKPAGTEAHSDSLAVTGSSSALIGGVAVLGGAGLFAGLFLMIIVRRRDEARSS